MKSTKLSMEQLPRVTSHLPIKEDVQQNFCKKISSCNYGAVGSPALKHSGLTASDRTLNSDGPAGQIPLVISLFLLSQVINPTRKGLPFIFLIKFSELFYNRVRKANAKPTVVESTGHLSPREQAVSSQEAAYCQSCSNWHRLTVTLSNKTVSMLEESIREQLLRITGKVIIFHIIPSNSQTHDTEIQYSSAVNQLCIAGLLNAFEPFKKCFPTAWYKLNQDVFAAV